jgi:hypothetical protein
VLSGARAICLQHPMRMPDARCKGDRAPAPLNSTSLNSTRLETRVTESIASGPAFEDNKADCGATGRRDEIMPREHGGDSTPEGSSIPRAARLNQSDMVFIFSIRLEPTKNLARVWLVPNARHVCEMSHSSYFRDVCFFAVPLRLNVTAVRKGHCSRPRAL